jgi:hypothetical protein
MAEISLMKRFIPLALLALVVLFLFAGSSPGQKIQADQRPNIVLMIADDLVYIDLPVYGNSFISMPNID